MAPPTPSTRYANQILLALSAADREMLRPHLESIDLPVRRVLEEPNRRIPYVYFIERGIASVVAVTGRDHHHIEIGVIGKEGMSGTTIVMGDNRSPHSTYIQVAGAGQRIRAAVFRDAMETSKTLRPVLLKFVQGFMVQTAHTAIANGRAKLDERLARWILMAHDRADGDELYLTHEFLSTMLGVRRAGVTVALHALEQKGLIRSARSRIAVLDRAGIEKIAGASYGIPEAEMRRLFG